MDIISLTKLLGGNIAPKMLHFAPKRSSYTFVQRQSGMGKKVCIPDTDQIQDIIKITTNKPGTVTEKSFHTPTHPMHSVCWYILYDKPKLGMKGYKHSGHIRVAYSTLTHQSWDVSWRWEIPSNRSECARLRYREVHGLYFSLHFWVYSWFVFLIVFVIAFLIVFLIAFSLYFWLHFWFIFILYSSLYFWLYFWFYFWFYFSLYSDCSFDCISHRISHCIWFLTTVLIVILIVLSLYFRLYSCCISDLFFFFYCTVFLIVFFHLFLIAFLIVFLMWV